MKTVKSGTAIIAEPKWTAQKGEPVRAIDADKMKADLLTVDPQFETMIDWCIRVLDAQPTIEPEREKGHWVRWYEIKEDENGIEYIPRCTCSKCDTEYDPHSTRHIRFCTFCGANMMEERR